jgi:hypothetical protein
VEPAAMFLVGHLVGRGEDVNLAGQAVPIGVEGSGVARFRC